MKIYKAAAPGQQKRSRIFPTALLTLLFLCWAGSAFGMGMGMGGEAPEVNFIPVEQVVAEDAGTATITVQLSTMEDPVNADIGPDSVHTLTITDNDVPPPPEVSLPRYHLLTPISQLLTSPTDVALDRNGRLYIADSYTNRVVVLSQSGSIIGTIDGLANPISVAVDDGGRIFVGNNDLGNVQVFDADFNFLRFLGDGDGEFSQPNDIAVDSAGKVYVVDRWNHYVKVYDVATGVKLADVGGLGTDAGQFTKPLSIAVDSGAQEIIVLDNASGARVQIFDMAWNQLRSFSKFGYYEGEMIWPKRLVVDSMSRLLVTDAQLNVALAYDTNGNFLNVVKENAANPLMIPMGLAIGEANILYIASHTTGKAEAYGVYEDGSYGYSGMRLSRQGLSLETWERGKNPAPQAINIFNTGNTDLNWTAREDVDWLSLSGNSGLVEPVAGQKDTLGITFNTQGLAAGEYHGYITISGGPGLTEIVAVRLIIKALAKLSVRPYSLMIDAEKGVPPTGSKITISNSGSLPLSWKITEAPAWLFATNLSGTIPDSTAGPEEVSLLPDTSLDAGTYRGTLTVSSWGALGSLSSIEVVLNIYEQVEDDSGGGTPPDVTDKSYQLTVALTGKETGTVTSDLGGIDCPGTCSDIYTEGTQVTLTAAPAEGSTFKGWSSDCTGTDLTCVVTLDKDVQVTAMFYYFPWHLFMPAILHNTQYIPEQ
ncbi:MAG: 6-bladed beta-propeller [Desulfobulbaceae bacterium]|nr:6-bladed beta-propeller [Desulfobulbaceae bacterium]